MKTKYAVLPSLFFIIQLVGVLPLRAEHYYFKQISLKEGLPSNVRCIYGAQNETYMSRSAEKWVKGLCFNELGVGG